MGSTMEASTSSFDKTVFVSPQDRGAVEAGYQRGLRPLEDGTLQGLDYNQDKLDNVKFGELRKKGISFDEAYTSSGGTITPRNITPELQPKMGYNPFEYNLGNNKYHVGNEVTKINKAVSQSTGSGLKIGTPVSASTVADARKSAASDIAEAAMPRTEASAVKASVASSAPAKAVAGTNSSTAKATKTMMESASEIAKKVTKGHGGSTGLLVAGAAAILGVAAKARSNDRQRY